MTLKSLFIDLVYSFPLQIFFQFRSDQYKYSPILLHIWKHQNCKNQKSPPSLLLQQPLLQKKMSLSLFTRTLARQVPVARMTVARFASEPAKDIPVVVADITDSIEWW